MSFFFDNSTMSGIPLSQYTAAISNTVASAHHLSGVWVIAELSDVRMSGGHCYMELIEKNETGQTIAKLRATIWRSTYFQLRQKFFNATNREISNGIKALVRGSLNHHSLFGLSFNIIDIDPSYTMGDMERLRREIIMRLQKEGVALRNKNLPFPIAPQRIAVISAEGAAGYGDFINHLCGNSENFVFYPCLFPCIMQGDKVSESIRAALQLIESTADLWDCIAIVRGGGATTDLNGFDDFDLAKAIATCALPVVVGIGHERDHNVLDEIAHTSLKTPTAVAGFFIDSLRNAYEKILNLTDRIRVFTNQVLRGEERLISSLQAIVPQLALRRIDDSKNKLQSISSRIPLLVENLVGKENIKIDGQKNILFNYIYTILRKEEIKIENQTNLLKSFSESNLIRSKQIIDNIESLIKVLDPQHTLLRGYSITRVNGKIIKNADDLKKGDKLTTNFHNAIVTSEIIAKEQ